MPAADSYLLVRHEDVNLDVEGAFYGVVKATRTTVKIDSVTPTVTCRSSIKTTVARQRQVQTNEAMGPKSGVWLRRVVRFEFRGYFDYRQVKDHEDGSLVITKGFGDKKIELPRIASDVYPVVVMALGKRRWSKRE